MFDELDESFAPGKMGCAEMIYAARAVGLG